MDKLAGPDRAKHSKNGRQSGQKIYKLAGLCRYRDDGDFAFLKVLLVLHPLVESRKDLEAGFLRLKQHLAVLLTCPPCFGHGLSFVAGQVILEFSW